MIVSVHCTVSAVLNRFEREQKGHKIVIEPRTNGLVRSSGGGGRRFKSSHSDHFIKRLADRSSAISSLRSDDPINEVIVDPNGAMSRSRLRWARQASRVEQTMRPA